MCSCSTLTPNHRASPLPPIRVTFLATCLCFTPKMSRTLSNAPGSDSPLKAHLVAKAPHSNAKLTRKENHRELRHDMLNVSLVVEPDRFLELFLPEPTPPAGKKARRKPKVSNPFSTMEKPTSEKKMYEDYVSHIQFSVPLPFFNPYISPRF